MLLSHKVGILSLKCVCGTEYTHSLEVGQKLKFITESNEYENLVSTCPYCGRIEIFNMNIEVAEFTFEETEEMMMPDKEINQRHYLREIINKLK